MTRALALFHRPGLSASRLRRRALAAAVRRGRAYSSTAHSADVLAVAAGETPVGVDVECCRPLPDWRALALDHFAPGEAAALAALDGDRAEEASLRLWTAKEAVQKALGRGIVGGMPALALPTSLLLCGGRLVVHVEGRFVLLRLERVRVADREVHLAVCRSVAGKSGCGQASAGTCATT